MKLADRNYLHTAIGLSPNQELTITETINHGDNKDRYVFSDGKVLDYCVNLQPGLSEAQYQLHEDSSIPFWGGKTKTYYQKIDL